MAVCETCGNSYQHLMTIHREGKDHQFDCFECAIQALAPRCAHCGVTVLGHGVEVDTIVYCSAHCARVLGERGLCDHAQTRSDALHWTM